MAFDAMIEVEQGETAIYLRHGFQFAGVLVILSAYAIKKLKICVNSYLETIKLASDCRPYHLFYPYHIT